MIEKLKYLFNKRKYLFKWCINKSFRIDYCHKTLIDKNLISYNEKESKWVLDPDLIGQLDNMLIGPNISQFSWSENPNGKCYLKIKMAFPEDAMTIKLILGAGDLEYGFNGGNK